MQNFDVSVAGTRDKLLNKQLSCQRFENPWRSCDIIAIIVHTASYLTMFSSTFSGMVCCIFPQSHVSHSDISLGQIIHFRSTNFWYLNYLYFVSSIIMAINKFIASLYTTSYHDLSWYNATRLYPVVRRIHDDIIRWKHFPRYWPFVRRIPRTNASNAELCCFLWYAPEWMVE